jgi:tetratricopeptide (TPR) repeat protein
MRAAGGSATDAERLKLGGAAGELMQRAEHDSSAGAQHAAGIALVLVEKPDEAIAKLESAARASHDAKSWSDLAAARYAAAVQFRRPSLYPEALAASDDALRIDARLPEALFNRALILENMGLISEARKAWQHYLEVDPGSPWANEARTHLAELTATTGASRWERDQPLLEAAAAAGDARKTLALVDAYRERARRFAEAEYLGRWADGVQHNNDAEATKWLTISRGIGNALAQLSGESLLRDAVQSIDNADAARRAKIAEAHVIYRRGRIAFSRDAAEAAERDFRAAASLFESASDPMALMARHYAASARLARNDIAAARAELEQMRGDADRHPAYLALGGHIRWELGRACKAEEDWQSEAVALTAAADFLRRGGENGSEGFVESMLALAQNFTGRPNEAWSTQFSAFRSLSIAALPDLLETAISGAARIEMQGGSLQGALALVQVLQSMQSSSARPLPSIDVLVQKAMLESMTGNLEDAARTTHEADGIAERLPDAAVKAGEFADIDVARGANLLSTDPRLADAALSRAINFFESHDRATSLPEPLLLRARCALRARQETAAARDLEEGIRIIERHPMRVAQGVLGTGVLDAGNALFEDAILMKLDHGDTAQAFAYAERLRGDTITIAELQHRLGGSGTAVLEIIALPEKVVTIAVSRDDIQTARRSLRRSDLVSLADRNDAGAATALYDLIIKPVNRVISRASTLIIVPDQTLANVSFGALYDSATRQYLIERLAVATTSSAASLRNDTRPAAAWSVAEITLPNGTAAASAELPEAEREIADVASAYPSVTSIPSERATWASFQAAAASAEIIHITGHTERQTGDAEEALLFAGERGSAVERVSWKMIIAATAPRPRVIVLAACETLRVPKSPQRRGLSLGAAFAAGGADVIGTLQPIPDRDARELFRAVHKSLAAGESTTRALRTAQIGAIRNEAAGSTTAWRALAVLTSHISR